MLIFNPIVKYKKNNINVDKIISEYSRVKIDKNSNLENSVNKFREDLFERISEKYEDESEKNNGNYEWIGVAQVKSERLRDGSGHVFQLIEPHLPIPFMLLRTREIDTQNDYEVAQKWVKNGFC